MRIPNVIHKDCRFFNGSKPCRWNKKIGSECPSCDHYEKILERILVIKLDAIGDVLRSTCIIPKIKEAHPSSRITWITKPESMELISSNPDIDETWEYGDTSVLGRLNVQEWDCVYNFDNSHQSSSLATTANSKKKVGFILSTEGIITPTNEHAAGWLKMASFDRLKKENKKTYQEVMYDICGFSHPICEPVLTLQNPFINWSENYVKSLLSKKEAGGIIVGVNTGSGARWPKKMVNAVKIIEIINKLLEFKNYYILLLGGRAEQNKNNEIIRNFSSNRVANAGCGHSLLHFAAIIKKCNVILSGDTLAMHIATALKVPAVVLFGPTSASEIYDYNGRVKKIFSDKDCLCCYSDCDRNEDCMSVIPVEKIIEGIREMTKLEKRA